MVPQEHARRLIDYFTGLLGTSANPEYAMARDLAHRWLRLIGNSTREQSQVEALVKDVESAAKNAGSGVLDLSLAVHAWARDISAKGD